MFNGLREGSALYILRKGDKDHAPALRIANVTKKGDPLTVAGLPATNYGFPQDTFVDIEAKAGEEEYKFSKLASNDTMRYYPNENTLVADNREQIIQEYENMCRMSTQALDTMPYHQGVVDAREAIMCQLNPQLAKEKEQEAKIGVLEGKINGIEGTLGNIQEMLAKALSVNAGSRKSNNEK